VPGVRSLRQFIHHRAQLVAGQHPRHDLRRQYYDATAADTEPPTGIRHGGPAAQGPAGAGLPQATFQANVQVCMVHRRCRTRPRDRSGLSLVIANGLVRNVDRNRNRLHHRRGEDAVGDSVRRSELRSVRRRKHNLHEVSSLVVAVNLW
jgi:hypothetical protein